MSSNAIKGRACGTVRVSDNNRSIHPGNGPGSVCPGPEAGCSLKCIEPICLAHELNLPDSVRDPSNKFLHRRRGKCDHEIIHGSVSQDRTGILRILPCTAVATDAEGS